MATRLEELLQAPADASAALSVRRSERRGARKQLQRAGGAHALQWVLSGHALRVALIAYGLAEYRAEASAKYLAAFGRQRGWPQKTEEQLARMVEDAFLAVQADVFAAMTDDRAPTDHAAIVEAIVYVQQFRAAEWARRQTLTAGVAPSTASLLRYVERDRLRWHAAVRPPSRGAVEEKRARAWVRRFRVRWGGYYGRIRIREPATVEASFEKAAAVSINSRPCGSGSRMALVLGSNFATSFLLRGVAKRCPSRRMRCGSWPDMVCVWGACRSLGAWEEMAE